MDEGAKLLKITKSLYKRKLSGSFFKRDLAQILIDNYSI
jgi:hypothetical protein